MACQGCQKRKEALAAGAKAIKDLFQRVVIGTKGKA